MLVKTHLAFALLVIILFFEHVENKIIFVSMVLIATILPDLDSNLSTAGKSIFARPFQFFVSHRGIIHSFTFAAIISVLIAMIFPKASLGFFMGYSVHLVTDSFTKDGIQPFWPAKAKSKGFVRTGGKMEESLFFSLIFVNLIVLLFTYIL